jgi:spore coat polysaccharide biosynthesis protein SpsF
MTSERLPGKILYRVQGKPLLQYLLESMQQCNSVDRLLIATSVEPSDDPVERFCADIGVACYRGSLNDVAKRFLDAAEANGLDAFVRISGDSPLMDYRLVERAVEVFRSRECDLVTNVLRRTFPKGCSVEVVRVETLRNAYPRFRRDEEREHVTSYFYSQQEEVNICDFESGGDYGKLNLSVDTDEDMRLFESVVSSMERPHWEYTYKEVLSQFGHLLTA